MHRNQTRRTNEHLISTMLFASCCWVFILPVCFWLPVGVRSETNQQQLWAIPRGWRGGSRTAHSSKHNNEGGSSSSVRQQEQDFIKLAEAIQSHLMGGDDSTPSIANIVRAFESLSTAQKAFKGLDGAAHEAYQRTHSTDEVDISISGRARRSAARAGATADGLGACELCELVLHPERFAVDSPNGTLSNRQVLLNVTDSAEIDEDCSLRLVVLFEPLYRGGAGIHHGGIEDLISQRDSRTCTGRLLILLADDVAVNMKKIIQTLARPPLRVRLTNGEVASVQPTLYKAACSVVYLLEPILRSHNSSAVHFVGHSLAGGVVSLAAAILEGILPLSKQDRKRRKKQISIINSDSTNTTQPDVTVTEGNISNITVRSLKGLAKGRCSAISLGSPPCQSANMQCDYVTSILCGDDIICRATNESIERFVTRTQRSLKLSTSLIGRPLNWVTDTVSLATFSLRSHAYGSEGEETRLAIPGRAYLIRPRRLGGICSIHEVGAQLKGGREALRAAVLWQLNDILLSESFWRHHQLESYIHGLDRVHLRGLQADHDVIDMSVVAA